MQVFHVKCEIEFQTKCFPQNNTIEIDMSNTFLF